LAETFVHTLTPRILHKYSCVLTAILYEFVNSALQHVSIFHEIIFREFFIYFLIEVADIKNY